MAPIQFKNVTKPANDLLNNDYFFDKKFKLSTKSSNGVAFTTEGAIKSGSAGGKLTAKFAPVDGVKVDKLSIATCGRLSGEMSFNQFFDGAAKVTITGEDGGGKGPAGSAAVEYSTSNVSVKGAMDIITGPTLYGSATAGYENFVLGGEVKYNTHFDDKSESPAFNDYNAALVYNGPDFRTSLSTKKKMTLCTVAMHHSLSKNTSVASTFDFDRVKNTTLLTAGGLYKLDASTTFQGKVDSNAVVSANLIQVVRPQVKLVCSASVQTKSMRSDAHKFGLQLVLG